MDQRLPAHVEASGLIRRVNDGGDFATILRKGDPDRGALLLILWNRGTFFGLLERELGTDFRYEWVMRRCGPALSEEKLREIVRDRPLRDPDLWLIELDVAQPERFIAETITLP